MGTKRICFIQACWHKEVVDVLDIFGNRGGVTPGGVGANRRGIRSRRRPHCLCQTAAANSSSVFSPPAPSVCVAIR